MEVLGGIFVLLIIAAVPISITYMITKAWVERARIQKGPQ